MIQTTLEWLLSQATNWVGSEQGGGILFGSTALAVAAIVAWLGKRAIVWVCSHLQGSHLPVRDFVQQLLTGMQSVQLWAERLDGTVRSERANLSLGRNSLDADPDGKKVALWPALNRHERRLLKQARLELLRTLHEQKHQQAKKATEDVLRTAVGVMLAGNSSTSKSGEVHMGNGLVLRADGKIVEIDATRLGCEGERMTPSSPTAHHKCVSGK